MKINLAKHSGFCFGVKRALDIAAKTARKKSQIYMLGDIVHNEQVVENIKKLGIKKIKNLVNGKGKAIIIRAHGAPLETISKIKAKGYKIIDATCPMVKQIHQIVRANEKKGFSIIIIGDKNHDEVKGIAGQLKNKALVVSNKALPISKIKNIKKACAVVQSTQNIDKTIISVKKLKKFIPELVFFNTICNPTTAKQKEIKQLPLVNDLMLIVGSKSSANTQRLYEISKSLNKKTYWVQSKTEIKPAWFKKVKNIGLAAGASTPESTIDEIVAYLKKLKK